MARRAEGVPESRSPAPWKAQSRYSRRLWQGAATWNPVVAGDDRLGPAIGGTNTPVVRGAGGWGALIAVAAERDEHEARVQQERVPHLHRDTRPGMAEARRDRLRPPHHLAQIRVSSRGRTSHWARAAAHEETRAPNEQVLLVNPHRCPPSNPLGLEEHSQPEVDRVVDLESSAWAEAVSRAEQDPGPGADAGCPGAAVDRSSQAIVASDW